MIFCLRRVLDQTERSWVAPPYLPGTALAMSMPLAERILVDLRNFRQGFGDETSHKRAMSILKSAILGPIEIAEPAVETLGALGSIAVELLDDLLELVYDLDRTMAPALYRSIVAIAPQDPRVIDAVRGGLREKDPYLVSAAAQSLARIGRAAKSAVPELLKLQSRRNAEVRVAVADALARIDGRIVEALEIFLNAMPFPFTSVDSETPFDHQIFNHVTESLFALKAEFLTQLTILANAESEEERNFAYWALGIVAPSDVAFRATLWKHFDGESPVGRLLAAIALYECGEDPKLVAHQLMDSAFARAANDRIERAIRVAATRTLARIGAPALEEGMARLSNRDMEAPEGLPRMLGELFMLVPGSEKLARQAELAGEPLCSRFEQVTKEWRRQQIEFADQLERARCVPPQPEIEIKPLVGTREQIVASLLWEIASFAE